MIQQQNNPPEGDPLQGIHFQQKREVPVDWSQFKERPINNLIPLQTLREIFRNPASMKQPEFESWVKELSSFVALVGTDSETAGLLYIETSCLTSFCEAYLLLDSQFGTLSSETRTESEELVKRYQYLRNSLGEALGGREEDPHGPGIAALLVKDMERSRYKLADSVPYPGGDGPEPATESKGLRPLLRSIEWGLRIQDKAFEIADESTLMTPLRRKMSRIDERVSKVFERAKNFLNKHFSDQNPRDAMFLGVAVALYKNSLHRFADVLDASASLPKRSEAENDRLVEGSRAASYLLHRLDEISEVLTLRPQS
ncbi:MAG: hypothetical protein KDD64_10960 [Bdellovibrionales bacterium]|nr:hypothetical protein [Bdellovibrionales bacterium]